MLSTWVPSSVSNCVSWIFINFSWSWNNDFWKLGLNWILNAAYSHRFKITFFFSLKCRSVNHLKLQNKFPIYFFHNSCHLQADFQKCEEFFIKKPTKKRKQIRKKTSTTLKIVEVVVFNICLLKSNFLGKTFKLNLPMFIKSVAVSGSVTYLQVLFLSI